jgi:hypothetical protein
LQTVQAMIFTAISPSSWILDKGWLGYNLKFRAGAALQIKKPIVCSKTYGMYDNNWYG